MKKLFVLAFALTVFALGAYADNVRPVAIGTGPATEPTLQSILDGVYGCTGCVNANTDQSVTGTWQLPGLPPQQTGPILRATASADQNAVGIYTFGGNKVLIFTSGATAGNSAAIRFNADGSITISDTTGGANCATDGINCGTFTGVNQANFGFYLNDQSNNAFYYTEDSQNGGQARALSYLGTGGRWTIAFEDGTGGATGLGDFDYNDRVITVESIVAAPEPVSVLLLGVGLLGFVRKQKKA